LYIWFIDNDTQHGPTTTNVDCYNNEYIVRSLSTASYKGHA